MLRAKTPRIPLYLVKASLAMFIARPAAEIGPSSQQDGNQLNITQLIGWLFL